MLSSKHRFHRRNHVNKVISKGQSVRGRRISLKYLEHDDVPYQVAVVVSKKVSKKAVVRNKIRRRIFAAIRNSEVMMPRGIKAAFFAYDESLATCDASELQDEVNALVAKLVKN